MHRLPRWIAPGLLFMLAATFAVPQEAKKYSIKTIAQPAPKEIAEPIAKLLSDQAVQLLDAAGKPICDVWFRKAIPADATAEQIKTGVTFREVKQTEILGAIQLHVKWTDYRKQRLKPGVYTMRLAYQPTDGKHTADIAEFQDYAIFIDAKADTKPILLDAQALSDKSGDSLELAHPAVFMLWPNYKPSKTPELAARPKNHWVVNASADLVVNGKSTGKLMGIGLTLVGHSPAE